MNDICRICGAELKGNQRRWIFSARAPVDLRVVLSHVLGCRLCRRDGESEFLCGKCAAALERLHRFDGVIARVQALSVERVRRLLTERGRLAGLLCRLHGRSPRAGPAGNSGDRELAERDYALLLQEDMSLAGYECWAEGSEAEPGHCSCPDRRCLGCSAFRVSDYEYDAVCPVPRRLARALATGILPRSKSISELAGVDLSPVSRAGSPWLTCPLPVARSLSTSSLGAASCSAWGSGSDLDVGSNGGASSEDWAGPSPEQTLADLARQLEGATYRPVRALLHSRIPVLVRGGAGRTVSGLDTPRQRLSYTGDEESELDMWDEYRPFNLEKLIQPQHKPGIPSQVTEQRKEGKAGEILVTEEEAGGRPEATQELSTYTGCRLVQGLARDLRSKERLLEECVKLISQLSSSNKSTDGPEDNGIRTLCLWLDKREEGLEKASEEVLGVLEEMESEAERLKQALLEKDRDIRRLGEVLVRNEEMINTLNASLGQKESRLQRLGQSMEQTQWLWEGQRAADLRGREEIRQQQQAALQSLTSDVKALSDSLLARGLPEGPDSLAGLCQRLQDKEQLLSEAQAKLSRQKEDQDKVIQELSRSLAEKDRLIQEFTAQEGWAQASHAQEMSRVSLELKGREAEIRRLSELQTSSARSHNAERLQLQALLHSKDQLILGLLEDGRSRDRILSEIQERLAPKVNVKHTL
ncbi:uncharacterized protein [Mobula birostris]|uniref:uncharacterized protein isoform X1 n=1 Tax=Mobula birostris TaxID=1983395 RepID=UPI003B282D20